MRGVRWCDRCREQVEQICGPVCDRCGQSVRRAGLCAACRVYEPHFVRLRSFSMYCGPLRNAMHRLKYRGDIALGEMMARPLISLLLKLNWPVDQVVPVPASPKRLAERGYNQAALLARPVALACGLPYEPGALRKVKETRSQVGLSLYERRENVAGAFAASSGQTAGRRVLVIDDLTTTSATIDACAQALLSAGAEAVYGLTVARAVHMQFERLPSPRQEV